MGVLFFDFSIFDEEEEVIWRVRRILVYIRRFRTLVLTYLRAIRYLRLKRPRNRSKLALTRRRLGMLRMSLSYGVTI